jgi:enterochelin esterase-like enzyme
MKSQPPPGDPELARSIRQRRRRRRQIRRRRLAAGCAFAAMLSGATGALASPGSTGGAAPAAAATHRSPAQTISITCASPALGGGLPAMVYLPAGYRGSRRRYPVVYFLHGLPANPTSYQHEGFIAGALVQARRSAIVVTPQGARSANSDREYLDWGSTENWPRAISHDLVACIDRRYRTIANRHGRVLAGLSAGGYGAANIGLRSLSTFAAVESWSGYFQATNPDGTETLELGSAQADQDAAVPDGKPLERALVHYPSYIGFYVGEQDDLFLKDNENYTSQLGAAGVPHTFHVYPGGHSVTLWAGEAPNWLTWALEALAHPPKVS